MSAKLDLRRVPRVYRQAFGWMLEPVRLFQADPTAFIQRPGVAFARLEKRLGVILDEQIADGGSEEFTRRLFAPMAAMTPAEWAAVPVRLRDDVAKRRRKVSRSKAGTQLLDLIDHAHASVRNGPLLACQHPEEHGKATLAAWERILCVSGLRGEPRIRALLDAIWVIWERVYHPYLRAVWKLLEIVEHRPPQVPPRGGQLMRSLQARIGAKYGDLVEPLALRVRDAVAHQHVVPNPSRKGVVLSNKDGWSDTFTVPDLERLAHNMMVTSTETLFDAMGAFLMEATMEPLLPAMPGFARAVVANDAAAIERTGELVNARHRAIWTDVARLYGRGSSAP